MVVILFSITVLCTIISLLLVTVFIIYIRMGSKIDVVISILFDGENISSRPWLSRGPLAGLVPESESQVPPQ